MGDVSAFRWDVDDLERSASGEAHAPLRAKPVVRRTATTWIEADGLWRATIGLWAVTVAESRRGRAVVDGAPVAPTWEWSAFGRVGHDLPRAVGCRGFSAREAAQLDAETSLSRLG